MSNTTSTPQESGSSATAQPPATQNEGEKRTTPENQAKPGRKKPRSPRTLPLEKRLLTVEQYLKRAKQDEVMSDLLRSTHKTKFMSFTDWEREAAALLKKNVI